MGLKDVFDEVGNALNNATNNVVHLFDAPENQVEERSEAEQIEWEINTYHPVMFPHIRDYYWNRVKLIKIDRVNQHRELKAFKDAVGYDTNPTNELTVLNLYVDQMDHTGWKFLPSKHDDYYFKHPFLWDTYISLNCYMDYLKKARISELERIAYDLGAKHIKIVFKEEETEKQEKDVMVKFLESGVEQEKIQNMFKNFELALDTDLESNNHLTEPDLLFFKHDTDMENLIHMRMDPDSHLKKKTYNFDCGGSQCMSITDAANVDATCYGSSAFSIKSKVETENRTILEYTIEF